MKGISLFASAGIGETYLSDIGIEIVCANELLSKRVSLYKSISPSTNIIQGDILIPSVFQDIINHSSNIDFIIASPPCQGMSIAGKNRCINKMIEDQRNYLILQVIHAINILHPTFILIENVPALSKLVLFYKTQPMQVIDILQVELGSKYTIECEIVNASDFGVPQNRLRTIIKLYKKGSSWAWASKENKLITVKEAIGHLPSLEADQQSNIKWHFSRKHSVEHITWMKHTPTGQSAFQNSEHYPKKKNGERIKGYDTTYRRMNWDKPAPTITMRNDAVSSQHNVHPGRLQSDSTYSDARVLTPLELMLLTTLPENWNIPDNTEEILIRQCIGESIPPLLIKKIVGQLL